MKVKYPGLAKLRTYEKTMSAEDFLATEFRQIIRALETASVDVESAMTSIVDQNRLEFLGQTSGNFSGSKFEFSAKPIKGTYTAGVWIPETAGTFAVEFGCQPRVENVPGPGTFTSTLSAFTLDNVLIGNAVFEHVQGIITIPMSHVMYFVDLDPTNGVYFQTSLSVSSFSRFNCKIFRVS